VSHRQRPERHHTTNESSEEDDGTEECLDIWRQWRKVFVPPTWTKATSRSSTHLCLVDLVIVCAADKRAFADKACGKLASCRQVLRDMVRWAQPDKVPQKSIERALEFVALQPSMLDTTK
jgi:hypothetical protein